MNDSMYEEYMRSVLGYQPINYRNTYETNFENYSMPNMSAMNAIQRDELERCYPDIYRIVYPMVQKVCAQNTRPLTRELVDNMAEEIYFSLEDSDVLENRNRDDKQVKNTEVKEENRQRIIRNPSLNDLIRILILRELLGRPGFPGGRPPRPFPPRPPMRPGPRPGGPFNRQSYEGFEDTYDLYEY